MLLNGRAPRPGEIIKLPNLAQTFRELGEKGKDGFYKGRIAQEIVDLIKSKGGVMELDDLAEHSSTFVKPIGYAYANEVTVYEVRLPLYRSPLATLTHEWQCPPNGQGAVLALPPDASK